METKCLCRHCRLNNANLWFMCHCVGLTEDKASHFSDQVNHLQRNIVSLCLYIAPLRSFAFSIYRLYCINVWLCFMHHETHLAIYLAKPNIMCDMGCVHVSCLSGGFTTQCCPDWQLHRHWWSTSWWIWNGNLAVSIYIFWDKM